MSGIIAVGHKHTVSVFNTQKNTTSLPTQNHPALFPAAVVPQTHLKEQQKFPGLL